ncbi:caspase family protein [Hymenobacter gelipurpurascens]|uniref:caspase family protein n=1 Tax=Hymenobacter gelipurpurascens TaxID=89968 RepID=UPI001131EBE8|nr:caspase family protein [Hymenobacter gelipurpurascens]
MADLFDALRRDGFQLRPNDYIEIDHVIDTFKPLSLADLKAIIAPLIVTSEEEQEKFDRIFDTLHQKPFIPDPPRDPVRWGLLTAIILGLIAFLYAAFLWPGPKFRTHGHLTVPSIGPCKVGDTLVFSVDSTLQKARGQLARWQWESIDNQQYPDIIEPKLRVVAKRAGPLVVNLRSQRGHGLLYTSWTDSLGRIEVMVCDKLPVVQIDSVRLSNLPLRYRFTARQSGFINKVQLTQWRLNGRVVGLNRNVWEHVFQAGTTPAYYDISFKAFPDTSQRLCFGEAKLTIGVSPPVVPPFTIAVRQEGELIVPKTRIASAYIWAMGLVGTLFVGLLGLYLRLVVRGSSKKPAQTIPSDNPLNKFGSDKPPLEIPFENRDAELITRDQAFYRTVRLFRQPTEGENRRLHVAQTMQATMREGGLPTLVYQPHRTETEYLFLIDRSQVRSQQVALFEYLFRAFIQENVSIERFFFHKSFDQFTNEAQSKKLSLRQLVDRFRTNTLVIWGDGYPLLYPPYPIVEPFIRDALVDWKSRAILTPNPFGDWGTKERALQTDFLLLPADVIGQLRLVQALAENQLRQDAYLQQGKASYSIEYLDLNEVEELHEYLGEKLFQWLAATAIYPRIRWEILVEIGRALMPPEVVNYTNLLKLARINWMHEGSFPDSTRLELLKGLKPNNEAKARQTLLRMLNYSEKYFPGKHFYDGEKYLLQNVNQFLLYAYNPEAYAYYEPAQQEFATLYEKGLFSDGAMLHYLENPAGDWVTLLSSTKSVKNQPSSFSLQDYLEGLPIKSTEKLVEPRKYYKRFLFGGAILALTSLIGLWYLSTKKQNQNIDWEQQIPINIAFDTTDCVNDKNITSAYSGDTVPLSKSDSYLFNKSPHSNTRWTVLLDDTTLYISKLFSTSFIPLRHSMTLGSDITHNSATLRTTLTVRDTAGREERRNVDFSRNTLRVRISCTNIPLKSVRPLVYIQYASSEEIDEVRQLQKRLITIGFNVPGIEFQKGFSDASQVRYFVDQDRLMADSVAQIVKRIFKLSAIKIVKVAGSKSAHLEVWMNNISSFSGKENSSSDQISKRIMPKKSLKGSGALTVLSTDTSNGLHTERTPIKTIEGPFSTEDKKLEKNQRRLALVIGNKDYQFQRRLMYPVKDAYAMQSFLEKSGFEVYLLTNGSLRSMQSAFQSFFDNIRKNDIALIYYGGDAFILNGENYLVPIDADLKFKKSVPFTCLPLNNIITRFNEAQSSTNLLILDACRPVILADSTYSKSDTYNGMAEIKPPREGVVAWSSSLGGYAYENSSIQGGVYTVALLKALQIPGLSFLEILNRVRSDVEKMSDGKQVPNYISSLSSDFYFYPKQPVKTRD